MAFHSKTLRLLCLSFNDICSDVYSALPQVFSVTFLYGNNDFLFLSAYFWLSLPLTILLSLAPHFLLKAWRFVHNPGESELFNIYSKIPERRPVEIFGCYAGASHSALKRRTSLASGRSSATQNSRGRLLISGMGSRPNMSTGLVSVDRGFGLRYWGEWCRDASRSDKSYRRGD